MREIVAYLIFFTVGLLVIALIVHVRLLQRRKRSTRSFTYVVKEKPRGARGSNTDGEASISRPRG